MTSQGYIKVELVRSWLFNSSLPKIQQFYTECFFSFFLRFISSWLQGPSSIVAFKGRVFHEVVWSKLRSVFYSVWNRQTVFPWKSFSEEPPFFVLFVQLHPLFFRVNAVNAAFSPVNNCPDQLHSLFGLPSPCRGDLIWRSSRPEVRRPASGWGLFWESSSVVPWFILNRFRDVPGVVPEWPWSSGFMRKSSSLSSAPSIRFSILQNSFWWLFPQFPRKLELYNPPAIWAYLSFKPSYSWDVPHSSPYSRLLVFFCCELPFYGEVFWQLIIDCLFYCRVKLEVHSLKAGK